MIKRISTVVCFMIGYSYIVIGQPSTPSAAVYNYAQYAETPPNLYTGAISESIPVGAVTAGPLSHNVGINYYFAGHRPSEISSCIGLGFQLQAGGAITRQVLGLNDFSENGWYNKGAQVNDGLTSNEIDDIVDGRLDPQSDVYALHVGALNIKFAMDHLGQFHTIPRSDLEITLERDTYLETVPNSVPFERTFSFFVIKDTQGNRYSFGLEPNPIEDFPPIAYTEFTDINNDINTTVYYLYKIEDHEQAHTIEFEYEDHDYEFYTLLDCEEVRYKSGSDSGRVGPECEMMTQEVKVRGKVIKKITGLANEIVFNYDEDRQDLLGSGKRLASIDVKTGSFTTSHTFKNQVYFIDNELQSSQVDVSNDAFEAMRRKLRLTEIEISGGAESIPNYSFDYYRPNGATSGAHIAYSSVNKALDDYGFINGKFNNNNLDHIIPARGVQSNSEFITFGHAGGIRDADANYSITTGLHKMTLPTGGTVTYNYEGNEIYDDREFIHTKESLFITTSDCMSNSFFADSENVTFTQNDIDFSFIYWELREACSDVDALVIKIEFFQNGNLLHNSTFASSSFVSGTLDLDNLQFTPLPNIEYEFRLSVLKGQALAEIRYSQDGNNAEVGGIRLKSKITSDGDALTNNDIIRSYDYTDIEGRSTGRIYSIMHYLAVLLLSPLQVLKAILWAMIKLQLRPTVTGM